MYDIRVFRRIRVVAVRRVNAGQHYQLVLLSSTSLFCAVVSHKSTYFLHHRLKYNSGMTTYFQPSNEDMPFIEQINQQFPEPANQPYLFYFFAGKQFYEKVKGSSPEQLISASWRVIEIYKTAFQSRYSSDDLMDMAEVSVALLAGDLQVVFTINAHSLAIEVMDDSVAVSQGPYFMKLRFDPQHKLQTIQFTA